MDVSCYIEICSSECKYKPVKSRDRTHEMKMEMEFEEKTALIAA
jgi:hypothetical protein